MDSKQMAEYLDQERWLMNSGLMTDTAKNQLFFCGSIVHKDVQAVELHVNLEKKLLSYRIFIPSKLMNKVNKYKELSTKKDLFSMWRFSRLLKKEGSLNFQSILNKFVKDYCGTKWNVEVEVLDVEKFNGDSGENAEGGWTMDQLPDPG